MTSKTFKKQFEEYLPLLSSKQQALVLDMVKSILNIDKDEKHISHKQYNKEIAEAVDRVEDGNFVAHEAAIEELSKVKPMSISKFHEMIDQAKQDHDAGRVISQEELKKKVKTWR